MKKALALGIVMAALASGPATADSILGDPLGSITRHQWGTENDPDGANILVPPCPAAQPSDAPQGTTAPSQARSCSGSLHDPHAAADPRCNNAKCWSKLDSR